MRTPEGFVFAPAGRLRLMVRDGAPEVADLLREAVDGLRPMFVWDHLYVGGGNARRLTVSLGDDVSLVANRAGIAGGIRLWDLDRPSPVPMSIPDPAVPAE